jgi:DNA polymerase-4
MVDYYVCLIDCDAFFTSVEEALDPNLKKFPIAVGSKEKRGVVATCNYNARKYGVKSAMSSKVALELCPNLIFLEPKFDIYKQYSNEVKKILEKHFNIVEFASIDEAYTTLDKDKLELTPKIVQKEIENTLGITVTIGISYNKFLAKLASDFKKPNSINIFIDNVQETLDSLDISYFHGIGSKTKEFLNDNRIYTGKDLRETPIEKLEQWFGRERAVWFYKICRGIDEREVTNTNDFRKTINVHETYAKNIYKDYEAYEALKVLVNRLCQRIQEKNIVGYTITLKARYKNFKNVTRSFTSKDPLNNSEIIMKVLLQILKNKPLEKPVRLFGLQLSNIRNINNTIW